MAPALYVKLLKVATNLWRTVMHFRDTLHIYSDFVFLYYIVYIQIKFSIISFQRIFLWISFHKKPVCHIQGVLKQAGKFL